MDTTKNIHLFNDTLNRFRDAGIQKGTAAYHPAHCPGYSTRDLIRFATLDNVAFTFFKKCAGKITKLDAILLPEESRDYIEVDVKFFDADGNEEWLCFRVDAETNAVQRWDFKGPEDWGSLSRHLDTFADKVGEIWG